MEAITITEVNMTLDTTDPTTVNVLIKYYLNSAPTTALFKQETGWRTDDIATAWTTWLSGNSYTIT